ncbi:geminivirus rep catalytic domain [Lasius niger]|uniref:Geminivirus rep catalytic domain n=1 Tax=Lasius niger TaxID=67767 RepID=A0A0J7K324_LASNI|nr:geminivirus rep catalytic domain [Lasius niger]
MPFVIRQDGVFEASTNPEDSLESENGLKRLAPAGSIKDMRLLDCRQGIFKKRGADLAAWTQACFSGRSVSLDGLKKSAHEEDSDIRHKGPHQSL